MFHREVLLSQLIQAGEKRAEFLASEFVLLRPPLLSPTVGLIKPVTYPCKPWLATGFRSATCDTIQRHPPPSVLTMFRTWSIGISQ